MPSAQCLGCRWRCWPPPWAPWAWPWTPGSGSTAPGSWPQPAQWRARVQSEEITKRLYETCNIEIVYKKCDVHVFVCFLSTTSVVFLTLLIDLKVISNSITCPINICNICPKNILPSPIAGLINPNVDLQFFVHLITCANASSPADIHRLFYHHYAHFQNLGKEKKYLILKFQYPPLPYL